MPGWAALRAARARYGHSQEEAALALSQIARTRVRATTFAKWERGERSPRAHAHEALLSYIRNAPRPPAPPPAAIRWARLIWGHSVAGAAREMGREIPAARWREIESGKRDILTEDEVMWLLAYVAGAERIAGESPPACASG